MSGGGASGGWGGQWWLSPAAPSPVPPARCGPGRPWRRSTKKGPAMTDIAQRNGVFHFEDLHVGQRFSSGTHALDEAQIKSFARQFDPQPFHVDDDQARDTLFGGLAASGWHTAAITMRLMVGGVPPAGG